MAKAEKQATTAKSKKATADAEPTQEAPVTELAPVESAQESKPKKVTKAGKHSEKGLKEAEQKVAKVEAQKARVDNESDNAPKVAVKPPRSRVERKGKNYRKAVEQIEKGKTYGLSQAVELALATSPVKFDATVELHINLGVDPRHADQNVRDTVVLPAGTGKNVRVAVFADVDDAASGKKAGADIAAGDEFLQQLEKGTIDFDVLIATPAMMPKLGKYARLLGPKGLMPNPKSGTVTTDITKAVTEAKAGRVEYRVDSTGIVHVGVGKVSFGKDKVTQNVKAIFTSIKSNKPASLKGNYVKAIHLTTSMGPSVRVEISEL